MTQSDGGTGSKRTPFFKQVKDLMEKHGFKSLEEMEAALGTGAGPVASGCSGEYVIEAAFSVPETEAKKGTNEPDRAAEEVRDDLDWIDEECHSVALVSKRMSLSLRPLISTVMPNIEAVSITKFADGPWDANPFDLRSHDRDREMLLKAKYGGDWAHFRISRALAEQVYGDARWPVPSKAVISHKEFKGYDKQVSRAIGRFRDLGPEPDKLREVVRGVLQRLGGIVFVNVAYHGDAVLSRRLDPRHPNPYARTLEGIAARGANVPQTGDIRL